MDKMCILFFKILSEVPNFSGKQMYKNTPNRYYKVRSKSIRNKTPTKFEKYIQINVHVHSFPKYKIKDPILIDKTLCAPLSRSIPLHHKNFQPQKQHDNQIFKRILMT